MTWALCAAGASAWVFLWCVLPDDGHRLHRMIHPPGGSSQGNPTTWALAGLTGLVIWLGIGGVAGAVAGVVAIPLVLKAIALLDARGPARINRQLAEQLPETLDLMRAGLDAGLPLRTVTARVTALVPEPTASLLGDVLGNVEVGRSDDRAWAQLGDHPVWGDLARDLARSAASGAAMSRLLMVTAQQARAELGATRTRRARAVGVRSVLPLVTCFLPAFVLVGVVPIIASTLAELNW